MKKIKPLSMGEFVALMALITALTAFSIDSVLPVLSVIGEELSINNANERQHILSILFLGVAISQLFFGPFSDYVGRKPAVQIGLVIFIAGSLISLLSADGHSMLIGRFMQGVGAGGMRIVGIAIVRDQTKGEKMARVMSLITSVFILIPAVAPLVGQIITAFSHWRVIFAVYVVLAFGLLVWFWLRQSETLDSSHRRVPSLYGLLRTSREVIGHQTTLAATLAMGMLFGILIGYINSAQQIFQNLYQVGQWFPLYFAMIALSFGVSSLINARLVERYGMARLAATSLLALVSVSALFLFVVAWLRGSPPLHLFQIYMMLCFSFFGLIYGNLQAMAMEPMGHIAGLASTWVGFISSILSLIFGASIGLFFNGTVFPLAIGAFSLSLSAYVVVRKIVNTSDGVTTEHEV